MTSLVLCNSIPTIILPIIQKLNNMLNKDFDQIIINEYKRGQSINQHINKINLFGNTIIILSLGSRTIINFNLEDEEEQLLELKSRSLLILQDKARYLWGHGIKGKNNDNGVSRGTRISITFRTNIFNF